MLPACQLVVLVLGVVKLRAPCAAERVKVHLAKVRWQVSKAKPVRVRRQVSEAKLATALEWEWSQMGLVKVCEMVVSAPLLGHATSPA